MSLYYLLGFSDTELVKGFLRRFYSLRSKTSQNIIHKSAVTHSATIFSTALYPRQFRKCIGGHFPPYVCIASVIHTQDGFLTDLLQIFSINFNSEVEICSIVCKQPYYCGLSFRLPLVLQQNLDFKLKIFFSSWESHKILQKMCSGKSAPNAAKFDVDFSLQIHVVCIFRVYAYGSTVCTDSVWPRN